MCASPVTCCTDSAHAAEPGVALRNLARCMKAATTTLYAMNDKLDKLDAMQASLSDMQRSLVRPSIAAGGRDVNAALRAYVRASALCKAPCASNCFCSCVALRDNAAAVAQRITDEIKLLLYQVDVHPCAELKRAAACRLLGVTSGDAAREKDPEAYNALVKKVCSALALLACSGVLY